jgi:pyruvate dehydrogenase E2 component (dihydrolipoamide acetyltransferase)
VPLAKPPVRKLAKDLGVDLHGLAGSAEGGVITREDVERAANGVAVSTVEAPAYDSATRERRVPIKGVRKATAAAMVQSAYTAPHVTEFLTIDVTPMMEFREKLKKSREFAGVKVTPLTFAAKAVCLAAKRTPDVNAVWDEEAQEIVYKDYVHLGIAAATPRGLVVPKVRDADSMSLKELAIALTALTDTAREGKTPPADMLGGTITITNVGVFGVDTGTPIINPGESAILCLGAIKDTPWVVDGEIKVRKVLQLSLSFDHRVVDGQQGSEFLADVGALLADPAMAITY